MRGNQIKQLTPATIGQLVSLPEHALALQVTVAVMQHLNGTDYPGGTGGGMRV